MNTIITIKFTAGKKTITADFDLYNYSNMNEILEELKQQIHLKKSDPDYEVTDWGEYPDTIQNLDSMDIFLLAQHAKNSFLTPEAWIAGNELGIEWEDIEEAYSGEFPNDEDFAENMADEIGAVDKNATWPMNCIDWEMAARDLMNDYNEQDGYYFRIL